MADDVFGPFRLVRLLGRGGMGEVWHALDTSQADREIALKLVSPALGDDAGYVRRFTGESELAARLPYHPNIVPIHRYGEIDGRLYLSMSLIEGVDLGSLLAEQGALPPDRAVRIVSQVAAALGFAESRGVVHRDVKPSNILVSRDGTDHSYLIDFGVARALDGARITHTGGFVGSPGYMAPERFLGDGDQRSDVYALGCVLHEALTGEQAFSAANPYAYMHAHHHGPVPRPSLSRTGLHPALDRVVARALAKDPGDRYQRAPDLAAAAVEALTYPGGPPSQPEPAQALPTVTPPPGPVSAPGPDPALRAEPISAAAQTLVPGQTPPTVLDTGQPTVLRSEPSILPGAPAPPGFPTPVAGRRTTGPRRRAALTVAALAGAAVVLVGGIVLVRPGADTPVPGPETDVPSPVPSSSPPAPAPTPLVARTVATGQNPVGLAVAPDGKHAYTTNAGSNTVSVIDTEKGEVTATIPVGDSPWNADVTPDGRRLYVVEKGTSTPNDTVAVIDTATNVKIGSVRVGGYPADVAVSPDGRYAYVANNKSNNVSVIDTLGNTVVATIPTAAGPGAVRFSPDGGRAYVACDWGNKVAVVDTGSRSAIASVPVKLGPTDLAVSPDGRTVYVVYQSNTSIRPGEVTTIDTATNTVGASLTVGKSPVSVAITPDGRLGYFGDFLDDVVSVVDLGTGTVVRTEQRQPGVFDMEIGRDGRYAFLAQNGADELSILPVASD